MRRESPKYLEDIRDAAAFIVEVGTERSFDQYVRDRLARQAVERNFEIIGEALNRLHRVDPETSARITEVPRIIAFRNILAHAYDNIDHEIVWSLMGNDLPRLLAEVEALLKNLHASD